MKKLTNPVFLQTTHYQLSEEDADLLKLEMAEIKESASPSAGTLNVRFNAIHAGTTRNYHTFLLEQLEESSQKWIRPFGRPVLKNHDTFEEPLGRIQEAKVVRFSDVDGVLQLVASISDPDAIQKIHDQRYLTVSVGVMASTVECSVCGVNWFNEGCEHTVGNTYQVEETGEEVLCTAVIKDIEPIELSFVNNPADADAEHYAGIINIGESHEIEFYADRSEGVTSKSKKKKSGAKKLPDNIALALKESYQEFLSLLATEGEDSTQMKTEETETKTDSVEESIADATNDSGTTTEGDITELTTEETSDSEENEEINEETISSQEDDVEESDEDNISALEEYLTSEDSSASEASDKTDEEVETEESADEASKVEELQNRVKELEAENAMLLSQQQEQQNAVADWIKVARQILSRHIADLKIILQKADGKEIEELETELANSTLKVLSKELFELREEFKKQDFKVENLVEYIGSLQNESLTPDKKDTSTISEEVKPKSFSQQEVVSSLTSLLSRKRTSQGRS